MNVVIKTFKFLSILFSLNCLFIAKVWALDVGDKVPACLLSGINDNVTEIHLEQMKGQALYIDFWASWCGPCVKSFPYMDKLERRFKEQDFRVIAINLDENIDDAHKFLKKRSVDFSVMQDKDQQCAKGFDVMAMPSSYLVDKQGIVQYIHLGFRSNEVSELEAQLKKIVNIKFNHSIIQSII